MVGDQTRGEHRCCGREGKGGRGRSGEAPSEEEKTLTLTLTLEGPLASPFFWLPVGPRAQASLPHSCLCQHVAKTPCCHSACTLLCGSICFDDQKAVGKSEVSIVVRRSTCASVLWSVCVGHALFPGSRRILIVASRCSWFLHVRKMLCPLGFMRWC